MFDIIKCEADPKAHGFERFYPFDAAWYRPSGRSAQSGTRIAVGPLTLPPSDGDESTVTRGLWEKRVVLICCAATWDSRARGGHMRRSISNALQDVVPGYPLCTHCSHSVGLTVGA